MDLNKIFSYCSDQELEQFVLDINKILASRQKQYPLHDLDLSVRCINAFKHINLYTLNDISFFTEQQLINKGIGKMSMKEIKEQLSERLMTLKRD